uniref:Uncharacterized protein n=1 Tax=Arundo donax TaxID=35708 RepID=A0A0A9BIA3_ARUDO
MLSGRIKTSASLSTSNMIMPGLTSHPMIDYSVRRLSKMGLI